MAIVTDAVFPSSARTAALGAVSGGPLADACGRRRVLALAAVPLLVGSVWCATACGFGTMAMARLVAGAGVGVVSACVPLFISEVAPTALRGALGGANQVMIGAGILAALLANVALGPAMWRWTFALAALPAALLLLGATGGLVTESPRWLAANGRTAEARKAAAALWGAAAESDAEDYMFLTKVTLDGDPVSVHTFPGSEMEPNALAVSGDGSFLSMVGYFRGKATLGDKEYNNDSTQLSDGSDCGSNCPKDAFLAKLSSTDDSNVEWSIHFPHQGDKSSELYATAVTTAGDIVYGGHVANVG